MLQPRLALQAAIRAIRENLAITTATGMRRLNLSVKTVDAYLYAARADDVPPRPRMAPAMWTRLRMMKKTLSTR